MTDLTGQIGLRQHAKITSPVPWLIERITGTNTHHTVICVDNEWCVSAEPRSGVTWRRINEYPSLVTTEFQYAPGHAKAVADAAATMIGTKYNYLALVVIALSCLLHRHTPERIAAWISNNKRLDCSQACDQAILTGTGKRLFDQQPGLIYPGLFEPYTRIAVNA